MTIGMKFIVADARPIAHDNDFDTNNRAYVPEVWAQESLMVLEENMVASNLVHRAFSNEVASYGDVVNTRRPGTFVAKRKISSDDVTIQDAEATKVPVKLNQHFHTSFVIKDDEMSKSFKDLVEEFLAPAIRSIAQEMDKAILAQVYQFTGNSVGSLGTDPGKSTVIAANTLMNNNKVPGGLGMRNFILTPGAEGALLDVSDFTKVNEAGDNGLALEQASLGNKFGFNFYMDQNAPSIAATQTVQTAAINNGNIAKGSTELTIDTTSDTLITGQWCTIAGDMVPQLITVVDGAPTTTMTIYPGLKTAVADGAVITIYPQGAIDQDVATTGYAADYVKDIDVDGFSDAPLVGQMTSYGIVGASVDKYGLIGAPTTTSIALDRETQSAMADNAVLNLGPAGDYCLAMHPNAIALVSRPLALVPDGFGARQAVVNYNGLSLRLSMQYEGRGQGLLVTADMLSGIKVLDTNLGMVMYA